MGGAWERQPGSRPERALYAVAVDPEREPLPDRSCGRCGGAIPPERDRRAKWSSNRCRRAAKRGQAGRPRKGLGIVPERRLLQSGTPLRPGRTRTQGLPRVLEDLASCLFHVAALVLAGGLTAQ